MIGYRCDKIVLGDRLFDGWVYTEGDWILSVCAEGKACETVYDYTGHYLAPGFIDLHTHGAGGHAFIDTTPKDIVTGCNFALAHGVTSILPTVMASPFSVMKQAVADFAEAKRSGEALGNLIGVHLEGPYLSAAQCGAQCPNYITPPMEAEYRALIAEYGDMIARWTYAPEYDRDGSFAQYLSSHGILPSAGHTDAKYEDVKVAMENGMKLITHLYSCTSTVTRDHGFRSLGVIESAFLRDDLFVELIADGKHLPPDLLRMIIKIKGVDRVALITDSMDIAGTNITHGFMGGTEFIVEDGVCKLCDRSAFAGSIATADRLLRVMRDECGFDLSTAVRMMTEIPANILNLKKGRIEEGYDADLIVFDENIHVTDVFVGGIKKL